MPRITNICICVYVFGCKLSYVKLCDSDCGITPKDDITIRITCVAFHFHTAHISFASSWYLFCLLVIVLARLCVFGTAMSIKKVFLIFLFVVVVVVVVVVVIIIIITTTTTTTTTTKVLIHLLQHI